MAEAVNEEIVALCLCPECSDIFRSPVILSCGHSFCKECLQQFWRNCDSQECPVCRRRSSKLDPLCNFALQNLCELINKQRSSRSVDICSLHGENLKLFCLNDNQPVCVVCRDSQKHVDHTFRPIGEVMSSFKMNAEDCAITQEELNDLIQLISTQDLPTAINTIKECLDKQDCVELNIGVTGESGSGKSTFVNAFRDLGDEEEESAITGSEETTVERKAYPHPKFKNVKVWDLPGIGSPNFKAKDYLKLVKFESYDVFIIISSDRFKEYHSLLAEEIVKMGKTFYFVRSKIEQSIDSEKTKKSFNEEKMLDTIREKCEKELSKFVKDPAVFLISSRHLDKYDFRLLYERLEKDLPLHKRRVLMLALPNVSLDVIKIKKKALEEDISKVAFLSAFVSVVPLPGLSVAVDLILIKKQIEKYYRVFGLDEASLQRLCEVSGKSMEEIKSLMKSPLKNGIETNSLLGLLSAVAVTAGIASLNVAENTLEYFLSTIPLIGSAAAGVLSYKTVLLVLKRALNDAAEDAENIFKTLLETDENA